MEFGLPKANLIKKPYQAFLDYFLPFSGSIIAKERHSYKYLAYRIKAFPSSNDVQNDLENIDFTHIECLPNDCLIKDYQVDLPWEKRGPQSAFQTSLDEIQV